MRGIPEDFSGVRVTRAVEELAELYRKMHGEAKGEIQSMIRMFEKCKESNSTIRNNKLLLLNRKYCVGRIRCNWSIDRVVQYGSVIRFTLAV